MIKCNEKNVHFIWDKEIEKFFLDKNFFIGYPWKVSGIIKYGTELTFDKSLTVEPFSCMAQGRFYSAGAFTYCRSRLIPPDFTAGRYCSIAPGVELSDQDHPLDRLSTHSFSFKPHAKQLAKKNGKDINIHRFNTLGSAPIIGNDVWIGKDALIKRGLKIGNGAVIAQRAVVTKDVPDYAIVAGVPARIVKFRFSPKMIKKLNESKWWNYSFFDFADIDITDIEGFLDEFNCRCDKGIIRELPIKKNLLNELEKEFKVEFF